MNEQTKLNIIDYAVELLLSRFTSLSEKALTEKRINKLDKYFSIINWLSEFPENYMIQFLEDGIFIFHKRLPHSVTIYENLKIRIEFNN